MRYVYKTMKSPVGTLKLVASEKGLAAILWEHDNPRRVRLEVDRRMIDIRCSSRPNGS